MHLNKKGMSFYIIVIVVALVGWMSYISILKYYEWSESFNIQEAVDHLKSTRSLIEVCFYQGNTEKVINDCIFRDDIQKSDTLHFNCCSAENNSNGNKEIAYLLYATRNSRSLFVKDEGGIQPACADESKARNRDASGAVLCRLKDGSINIQGWGIYQGNYN